jgi:hypothetical protein
MIKYMIFILLKSELGCEGFSKWGLINNITEKGMVGNRFFKEELHSFNISMLFQYT